MIEFQSGENDYEIEQAKTALSLARAYHAGVELAARHRPDDPCVQHRLAEAVQQGRGAWQAYFHAAEAGRSAQMEAVVPEVFRTD